MKMMKTDMEFVAFDAQDVIATSGGILFISKNGTQDNMINITNYFSETPKHAYTENNRPGSEPIKIYLKIDGEMGYDWYTFDSATCDHKVDTYGVPEDYFYIKVTGYDTKPTGTEAIMIPDILAWLYDNTNNSGQ